MKQLDEQGFEFKGETGRIFLCRMCEGNAWFFYKRDGQWTKLRPASTIDILRANQQRIRLPEGTEQPDEKKINFSEYLQSAWGKMGNPDRAYIFHGPDDHREETVKPEIVEDELTAMIHKIERRINEKEGTPRLCWIITDFDLNELKLMLKYLLYARKCQERGIK